MIDVEFRNSLLKSDMGMIVSLAKHFNSNNDSQRLQDLTQEGVVAYLDAYQNFKDVDGTKFSTYAHPFVRKAMLNFTIKNSGIINQVSTDGVKKAYLNLHKITNNVGTLSDSQIDEIAIKLDVSKEDVLSAEKALTSRSVNITETHSFSLDNERYFIGNQDCPFEINQEQAYSIAIKKALNILNERKKLVIKSRYFCTKKATLKSLADKLSISIEGVRSMEKFAISEMKATAEQSILLMEH
jgi:RNA polymerase sigma factor (sigma-70 family)